MDAFVWIVFVVVVVIIISWLWWSSKNSILTNWPVVGMFPALYSNVSRIHDLATDVLEKSNGTFMFKGPWFCGMDFLLTSNPMNVHHTLSKNFSNYHKGVDFIDIFDYFGDGLLTSDFDAWRIQRFRIHLLFKNKRFQLAIRNILHQKNFHGIFSILDNASCTKLGNHQVDFKDMFQRFSFDNVCLLVFGVDPNTLSVELPRFPFEKAFDDIAQVIFYRHIVPGFIWKLQRWLQIGQEKKMTKARLTFDHFVENCMKTKEEQLQKNEKNINEFDALTYFLQVEKHDDEQQERTSLDYKFIRDMAIGLLFAGRDTTSAALSWTFWLIMTNPSSHKKILEEIEQHFGICDDDDPNYINDMTLRFFDSEKMTKLVYLHGAICEALRLYPSVPFEHKVSIESDVLPSGHHISKNTKLLYSLYSMGRMKEIWGDDCLEFKPVRWISESGGGIKRYPSYKFPAFNAGPRICLGKDVVFFEIKVIVCAILSNYSIELIEDQHVSPSNSVILQQKNGLKVKISKKKI